MALICTVYIPLDDSPTSFPQESDIMEGAAIFDDCTDDTMRTQTFCDCQDNIRRGGSLAQVTDQLAPDYLGHIEGNHPTRARQGH